MDHGGLKIHSVVVVVVLVILIVVVIVLAVLVVLIILIVLIVLIPKQLLLNRAPHLVSIHCTTIASLAITRTPHTHKHHRNGSREHVHALRLQPILCRSGKTR